jgi:hypothetical protein
MTEIYDVDNAADTAQHFRSLSEAVEAVDLAILHQFDVMFGRKNSDWIPDTRFISGAQAWRRLPAILNEWAKKIEEGNAWFRAGGSR